MDAYRIAVRISMQNGVSSVLKVIQRDLLGLNQAVDVTQKGMGRLKLAVAGAGMTAVGAGLLDAFKGLAEAGGQVLNQQAKMAQLGISNRDIALETAEAYKNIGTSGTTIAGNMAAALKLRGIFGGADFTEANMAVPAYLKAQFALQGAGIDPSSIEDFIKPLDVMGAFRTGNKLDPSKFGPAIQMAVSAVLSSGGLLTGAAFQRAIQLAGPAAAQMGEKTFFNTMLEPLLALGNKAARGLQYGGSTFIGGQMSKASAHMLDRLGLTRSADYTHEGGRWTLDQGKIAGSDLLTKKGDIIDWISNYFLPAAARAGLNPMTAAASLPQTLQALISTVYEIGPQIAKSVVQQAQANAANPYTAAQAAFTSSQNNLTNALTGLWQALGTPAAYMAVNVMNRLSDAIRNFTGWVGNHQAAVGIAEKVMGGLGIALAALGTVAVAAAIAGMVGTGGTLVLLAGALGGLGLALKGIPGALDIVNHDLQKFAYDLIHPGTWFPGGSGTPNFAHRGPAPLATPYTGPGALDTIDHATHAALKSIRDWINGGAPVAVTNPNDIARASTAVMARNLRQGLTAPQTGSSTANYRATPSGSAAASAR